jgi:hypothetical protein
MTTSTQAFTLGEPQVAGPLTVFPVFGPAPRFVYRSLSEAIELGALVKELDGGASVGDLALENSTDGALLVFEGEEVLGAKQNRTFDSSVLVGAGSRVRVPVSCVEQSRWSAGREAEPMVPAPQAADPALRRLKRAAANRAARAGQAARADQGEVWQAVDLRLAGHGVESSSGALNDLYKHERGALLTIAGGVAHREGQLGALAAVSGRPQVLDLVSRPGVFASLLPRLAQGYALDALSLEGGTPDRAACESFLSSGLEAPRAELPTPGLGCGIAVAGRQLIGSGLEYEGELVQLSVFDARGPEGAVPDGAAGAGRILRPSRRRAA